MINTENPTGNLLVAEFHGKITASDYEQVLAPAVNGIIEEHGSIRALVRIGEGFEGWEMGAALEDAKLGAGMWRGWDRLALATDVGWIRHGFHAFSPVLPCASRVFGAAEVDDARRWLEESLGTVHLSFADGILRVQLIGDLEARAYEGRDAEVDGLLAGSEGARLLVDVREFEGWQDFSAVARHFTLMFGHRNVIRRAALLGNAAWQKLAVRLGGHLLRGDAKFFEDEEQALAWVAED